MRNWNNLQKFLLYSFLTSFQTTYEELKLKDPAIDKLSMLCFQTTYEELKLQAQCKYTNTQTCFQTTYEELKLSIFLPDSMLIFRFQTTYEELKHLRRNKQGEGTKRKLPDYLWGIETP